MNNIFNFISKNKLILLLLLMVVIGGLAFISMKAFLYPTDENTVYGDRLSGIDEVRISADKKEAVSNKIKEKEGITSATVSVKGKIININIVATTKENTFDIMKEYMKEIISNFSEKEIAFYDIQIFINNKDANYDAIGYKNKNKEEISWVFDEIVSEVEEDEEA